MKIGDRDGLLILVDVEPPRFPSRWCRWLTHSWVTRTERQGATVLARDKACQECGAEVHWRRFDSVEARAILERSS